MVRIIRSHEYRVMPWKNGGGETAEIAVSPEGAALDAFEWRLSMATVAMDGPFSAFPGIDRTLAILDGEGIRLVVGTDATVTLTKESQPHPFAADQPAAADLLGGPIVDLNMMSRRGHATHSMTRLSLAAPTEIALDGAETLVFCADGAATMEAEGKSVDLAKRDTIAWAHGPAKAMLRPRPTALIYLVKIRRA